MRNLYRVFSLLLVIAILASCVGTAFATEAPEEITPPASTCGKHHTRVETWPLENNQHYTVCYDCHTAITEACTFQVHNRINPTATTEGSIIYICGGSSAMSEQVSPDYFTGNGCGSTYKVSLPAGSDYTYTNNHNGTHTLASAKAVETNLVHRYTNGVCACGEKEHDFLTLQFNESSAINESGAWTLNDTFVSVDTESGILFGTAYKTDPYLSLDAKGHMINYSIKSGDIVEVRMKSKFLSGSAKDIQFFYTTTANPGYSEGRSVKLANVTFTEDEYQIYRFSLTNNIGEVMNALRLDPFSNNTTPFKAEFQVDYIYVGAPAHAPSNYEDGNLHFDYVGGADAVAKYSANDAYNGYNFDDAATLQWTTTTTGFKTGNAAIDNASGTLTISPKEDSSEFIFLDTAAPLSYEMRNAEVLQVRLKMENFKTVEGKNPFMTMEFRSEDSNLGNSPDLIFPASQPGAAEYITYTVTLSDALRATGTIDTLRLYFGNVSGNSGSKLTIDYIYVGTEEDLPENAWFVNFCNEDGTVLSSQTVNLGQSVSYNGATPTKAHDAENHYSFAGWVDTEGNPANLSNITGTTTVYATYTAENHSFTDSVTTQPGCTAQGIKTYTCTGCERSYTEDIAATGHRTQLVGAIQATCMTEGYSGDLLCIVCGEEVEKGTVIPKGTHVPVTTDGYPATCISSGMTAGTNCGICGITLTAPTIIPATGHTPVYEYEDEDGHVAGCANCAYSRYVEHIYEGGICVCGATTGVVGPIVDESIKINHSLNLTSDISINFAVKAELLTQYDSYYLECMIPTYEKNALVGSQSMIIQPELRGTYYYFSLDGLTSLQMNDVVEATLHMTKDGIEYVSTLDRYSVATYAYAQLNKAASSDALKEMCANLLQYGAKAQLWKGYRTDALADSAMTEEHKGYLTDLETVVFGQNSAIFNDVSKPTVTLAGKALSLDSKVVVRFIMDVTNYTGSLDQLSLRVSYVNINGEKQTVILTEHELYNPAKNYYAFNFDSLLAAELRTVLSVAVYNGETQLSPTMVYSADTYGNGKTGALLTVMQALIAYSDSAKDFFAK